MINRAQQSAAFEAAQRLARRGFQMSQVLQIASEELEGRTETTESVLGKTQEQRYDHWHEKEYGYKPMVGLSWVDYSDIQAQFDDFGVRAYKMDAKKSEWRGINHIGSHAYGILNFYEQKGGLIAQAYRNYKKEAGHTAQIVRPKREVRASALLSKRGFSDALYSVLTDVDLCDPVVQHEMFLKYMLIRQDFIGGSCHHCKSDRSTIIGTRGKESYMYLYKCNDCWGQFSPKTGTLLQKSRLPFPKMLNVIQLAMDPSGIAYRTIAEQVGVNYGIAHDIGWTFRSNSILRNRWPGEHFGVDDESKKLHWAALAG